ncbi:MAG TPA: hypothetical protein VGF07_02020 [Stellaceae bacterium]|jgi:hypothetical protein
MSAEPWRPVVDLTECARWRGGDMRACICRLPNLGGWAECPPEVRGVAAMPGDTFSAHDRGGKNGHAAPATQGFTGDACDVCGNFRLVRTGTCATCLDCGSTGGCG